jgi:hypothetical protein
MTHSHEQIRREAALAAVHAALSSEDFDALLQALQTAVQTGVPELQLQVTRQLHILELCYTL